MTGLLLWLVLGSLDARADPEAVRVFALPQGGELLVVPTDDDSGVAAALVAPGGWSSPNLPAYAKIAWEYPEAAQADLGFLAVAAPGRLDLTMEADHSVALVFGQAIDERFTALVASAFEREPPFHTRWSFDRMPLDTSAVLSAALTGSAEPDAIGVVDSNDLTKVVKDLSRHPDRVMVVAGNVTEADALQLARRALPAAHPRTPHAATQLHWPQEAVSLSRPDVDSTWQIWGWPALGQDDASAGRLLWSVLERRVTSALRGERGWTYAVVVSKPVGPRGTACHLAISTPPSVAAEAHALVVREVVRLADEAPSSEELDRARRSLLRQLSGRQPVAALGLEMAVDRVRSGAWSPPGERVAGLSAVRPTDLRALARQWLVGGPSAELRIDPEDGQ